MGSFTLPNRRILLRKHTESTSQAVHVLDQPCLMHCILILTLVALASHVDCSLSLSSNSSRSSSPPPNTTAFRNVLLDPFPVNGTIHLPDCPLWLQGYIGFHQRNRGKPGARYLVFVGTPTGLGDTLRGLKYTLKLAAATNRVLLIHDRKTSGLSPGSLLMPSVIDWTYNTTALGLSTEDVDARPPIQIHFHSGKHNLKHNRVMLALVMGDQRVLRMKSTMLEMGADLLPLPARSHLNTSTFKGDVAACHDCTYRLHEMIGASCSLRALFKASPALAADYAQVMHAVFNTTRACSYNVVHIRMGGFQGGQEIGLVESRVAEGDAFKQHAVLLVLRALACAQKNAKEHNITTPTLLLTDNAHLRHLVQQKFFGADVVSTPFEAVHLSYNDDNSEGGMAAARSIYVDLMLMAGARCLLAPTRSGLNHQARLWGAVECFNPYHGCQDLHGNQTVLN